MFAQFFGSFLLGKDAVTAEQLAKAISKTTETRLKLGTLAMHQGLMSAEQVDEVCYLQSREDKRFGEIAVEREYLTEDQVEALLATQPSDFLILGQALVDLGYIDNATLELLIYEYQYENEINDLSVEDQTKMNRLVRNFFSFSGQKVSDYSLLYITLAFNNLVRFIGSDFTPLNPIPTSEYMTHFCVTQKISGSVNFSSSVDMDRDAAIAFASRYAKMEFCEFDEYVQASVDDFLNLHNGLYLVNMSNEYSMELQLSPPETKEDTSVLLPPNSFVIPVFYPFGTIYIIVSM